jgi:hypothetical protein
MITPEHLHLALNHLPFLGAGFAIIPLAVGFITKNKNAVLAGLLIAVLSGWVTPIVMETGESAYERYEKGPIASFLDPQAEQFLEIHEHRAEAWSKSMYANAVSQHCALDCLYGNPIGLGRYQARLPSFVLYHYFQEYGLQSLEGSSAGLTFEVIRSLDFRRLPIRRKLTTTMIK